MKKLWGGRFNDKNSDITEKLSVSVHYDKRLYRQDIRGSIVHSEMLNKIGILSDEELGKIINGLNEIQMEIENNSFDFEDRLEDVHMNIESRLTDKIGYAGKKMHTGRSRNDQIALDTRLYLKDECCEIDKHLVRLIRSLMDLAEKNKYVILPGYTHMQVAQPVRFSHHMLAYCWQLVRDRRRLDFARNSSDYSPIGVGALAGVNYGNDRHFMQQKLEFGNITQNSMDTVSDRDYMLDFLYFASVLGTHLSRFCEELVLWSSSQFDFIRLSDKVTTGSSIMPQKKNPDLAEIIRGKTGRLNGNLVSLLTVLKGLPMTYNRDLQEDKESLFDSVDTVLLSLEGMIEMMKDITVKKDKMRDAVYSNFSTATDLADYLSQKGVPFREAHEIIGTIVGDCEKNNIDFFKMKFSDFQKYSEVFQEDVLDYVNPESSTDRKISFGGTSIYDIDRQLEELRKLL